MKCRYLWMLFFAASFPSMGFAQMNYASFDLERAFNSFYRTEEARKQVHEGWQDLQDDNFERLGRIKELESEISAIRILLENPTLTQSQRNALNQDLNILEAEMTALERERGEFYERRIRALRTQAAQRTEALRSEIESAAEAVRSEFGYDAVFDTSGQGENPIPGDIHPEGTDDIGYKVVANINEYAPEPDPDEVDLRAVFSSDPDFDGWPYGVELAVGSNPMQSEGKGKKSLGVSFSDGVAAIRFDLDPSKKHLIQLRLTRSAGFDDFGKILFETDTGGASLLIPELEQITINDTDQSESGAFFYRLEAKLRE